MNVHSSGASLFLGCVGLLLAVPLCGTLPAAESEPEAAAAVEAAADGLRRAARFPWYDAQQDELRPVPLPAYEPPRQSADWQWQPAQARPTSWPWLWDVLQYAVWAFLVLVLCLLLLVLLRGMARRFLPQGDFDDDDSARRVNEADRIENLPFAVKRPQTDLLGESRWHYEQGNYGEAIVYLFSYQLVQLDTHHFVRLAKGRTNRQYLRDLLPTPPLRDLEADHVGL